MAGEQTYVRESDVKLAGAFQIDDAAVLTPAQLTANTDNYNPTGFQVSNIIVKLALRMSTDTSRELTGIVPSSPAGGNILYIVNIGSNDLIIKNNVTSTAANRFLLDSDITIKAEQSRGFRYDTISLRWRPLEDK